MALNLESLVPEPGQAANLLTVTASVMIARLRTQAQGQMSQDVPVQNRSERRIRNLVAV